MKAVIISLLFMGTVPVVFSQSFTAGQDVSADPSFVLDSVNERHEVMIAANVNDFFHKPVLFPFDINKDGITDMNSFASASPSQSESGFWTGIKTTDHCQLVHIANGESIDNISWHSHNETTITLNYEYSEYLTGIYDRNGYCEFQPLQYFAFRISSPGDPTIIMGWIEVVSYLHWLTIVRYAYVVRDRPVITAPGSAGGVNGDFMIEIQFPKPVSGFTGSGLHLENGLLVDLDSVQPALYRAEISPVIPGEVITVVLAHSARDQEDNYNIESSEFIIVYDTIRPTVQNFIKTYMPGNPFVGGEFILEIRFRGSITGFRLPCLVVENGAASRLDSITPMQYRATIVPGEEGDLAIYIPDKSVRDISGNLNMASDTMHLTVDYTPPFIIASEIDSSFMTEHFDIYITFSERVEISYPDRVNCYYHEFDLGDNRYKFSVTATKHDFSLTFYPNAAYLDLARNWNQDLTAFHLKASGIPTGNIEMAGEPLKIFPNPSGGSVTIDIQENGDFILELMDMKGNTIVSRTYDQYMGETINLSDLHDGVYQVFIRGKGFSYCRKLIVISD